MASSTTTTKTKEETVRFAPEKAPSRSNPTGPKTDIEQPKPRTLADMSDSIDQATFDQILEMDEEGEHDFSKGIVYGFFDQAESTFEKMETALYVTIFLWQRFMCILTVLQEREEAQRAVVARPLP